MDFATSINTCLVQKFADFTGRASRSEFWFFQLFLFLAGFIAGIIDIMILNYHPDDLGPMAIILYVIIIIPAIAVTARRLHDVNQSGWWQLIVFTIIGIPVLLYWYIIKGTDGSNEYGEDSL